MPLKVEASEGGLPSGLPVDGECGGDGMEHALMLLAHAYVP